MHDAVGREEVLDGGALAQELGVGDVARCREAAAASRSARDVLAGAHRHGALHDEHTIAAALGDLVDDAAHARQVGVARRRGRRVDGDEEHAAARPAARRRRW